MLPEALLLYLNEQIPCRERQIKQIASLLDTNVSSPRTLVLHGLEATGKTLTIKAVLEALGARHVIVNSRECITARHLLECTVTACKKSIEETGVLDKFRQIDGRCESLSALAVQLQRLLEDRGKFILVFDAIDKQRDAPPTLLSGIGRLGEIIPNLFAVVIVTAPQPRFLHLAGVPHIHFNPYNRAECLKIVGLSPPPIFVSQLGNDEITEAARLGMEEDDAWLWSRFCGAVWDSLGKGAARDVVTFRIVCERLWTPFVMPIRDRSYGTRDFSKLMVKNRALFQSEAALIENIVPLPILETRTRTLQRSHELPSYTSYLLIAAYLASYNPSRQDQIFFMKAHEKKRKKKGGGTAKGRLSKHRKIQRKLLGPQPFLLERLLAIFHAIFPHEIPGGAADTMTQITTLSSLRLIVKAMSRTDILDAGTKWRVNIGWEYVQRVASKVKFDIASYLVE